LNNAIVSTIGKLASVKAASYELGVLTGVAGQTSVRIAAQATGRSAKTMKRTRRTLAWLYVAYKRFRSVANIIVADQALKAYFGPENVWNMSFIQGYKYDSMSQAECPHGWQAEQD